MDVSRVVVMKMPAHVSSILGYKLHMEAQGVF